MDKDLAYLAAAEQLAAFRTGALRPSQVLAAQLQRIETLDQGPGGINAITEVLGESAMAQAAQADERYDRARRHPETLPPLLGLSVATKEKHALAGHSLSQGLLSQRQKMSQDDHPIVERLKVAGAIIHARTTSPEFSCATVTHSPMWGVTRNPFNRAKSPGGSSGGAGAALAAGFTTLATASDIAGSTRIPAAFTGTVGYKAPYGRIPGTGFLASDWYRGDGPMGRTVQDVALLSSVISGQHNADANSWGPRAVSPLPVDGGNIAQLRFGFSAELGDFPVSPTVRAAFLGLIEQLRATGAAVSEVHLPWTTEQIRKTTFAHFGHILAPAMTEAFGTSNEPRAEYTDRFIADAMAAAAKVPLFESLRMDALVNEQLAAATREVDILLCPTNAMDWLDADGQYLDGLSTAQRHLAHYWEGHLTSPFNVANRRAVLNIPLSLGESGVPIGMQVVGPPLAEQVVFAAAAQLEALIGFNARAQDLEPLSVA